MVSSVSLPRVLTVSRICSRYVRHQAQKARCWSKRARSGSGRVPSRYSVMSSTSSLQLIPVGSIAIRAGQFSLDRFQVLLQHRPHLRARAMEQYPLISLGNAQKVTHFFGRPFLDVAQSYHLPLVGWKGVNRLLDDRTGFLSQKALFRVRAPGFWRCGPVVGPLVVGPAEA